MNIREIVAEYLLAHNCDGLCGEDWGCGLGNLMWCDEPNVYQCVAAVRGPVPDEYKAEFDDWFVPATDTEGDGDG